MSREDCEVSEDYQLILRGVSEKKSTIGKSVTLKVTERCLFVVNRTELFGRPPTRTYIDQKLEAV